MLVLSRKLFQKIHIGNDITIVVVRIENDKVRIGIQAPDSVVILRDEIVNAARKEKDDTGEPSEPVKDPG